MKDKFTPNYIESLEENEVFVFGSNLDGYHIGGAARIAKERFGAVWGQGVGLQGKSYAIPTMQGGVETITPYVDEFLSFAQQHKELQFLVTRIGCGIAGFKDYEIAPLFKNAIGMENICLPKEFVEIINEAQQTNTLDIRSNGLYPSNVLSNLCSNGFRLDGMVCSSMEGFLQSLKRQDINKQRQICSMKGGNARKMSVTSWQTDQIVWWKGKAIDRQGQAYQELIHRAYKAMFEQNERFRAALMQTRGMVLAHSTGEDNPYKTILTSTELCGILTALRDNYDKRDKTQELIEKSATNELGDLDSEKPTAKKIVYVDMGGVLMDFHAGLELIGDELRKEYAGRYDEVPNIVSYLPPVKGAVEAMCALQQSGKYDIYILSTSPWSNPTTWSDKVEWINRHLDKYYCKRLILSHHKNLLRGDYIIDDRGKHGTSSFKGEWIRFGSDEFPDWDSVLVYLQVKK